jgi:hypothetical protein
VHAAYPFGSLNSRNRLLLPAVATIDDPKTSSGPPGTPVTAELPQALMCAGARFAAPPHLTHQHEPVTIC